MSQVVPPPYNPTNSLVQNYLDALKKFGGGEVPDFAMLEGFVMGNVICEMLSRSGRDFDRESFLQTAKREQTTLNIFVMPLVYGPRNNAGTSEVYVTRLDWNGKYVLESTVGRKAA